MEPVGLAIGIAGLAGLFSTCLEVVGRVDSYRHYESDSKFLTTQFKAEKLRFEQWGQAVGFNQGRLATNHHKALDDPRISSMVEELLSIIFELCRNADDAFPQAKSEHNPKSPVHALQAAPPPETKGRRTKWVLRDKTKRMEQVGKFATLVQTLHNLIPLDGAKHTSLEHKLPNEGDHFVDREAWTAELRETLAKIEAEIDADVRRDLHTWLLGHHLPNELYDNSTQRRLEGTCNWILSTSSFQSWLSPDVLAKTARLLWINGPAGFGKTVLCARVIEHLSSTLDTPVAHFFFSSDFESLGDPFVAIRSWISQLLFLPSVFELVRERWATQYGKKASRTETVELFRAIVQDVPGCIFVLDGLDECNWMGENRKDDPINSVTGFLETLVQAVVDTNTRIMVVSRYDIDIRHGLASNGSNIFLEHKISPEDVQPDVSSYSRSIVDKKLSTKNEMIKDGISQRMADRCNGQFLWLKMQEGSLQSWKNKKQLEDAIDKTPTGLDHLYDRTWAKILKLPSSDRSRAVSLLRWAAFSLRPLTVYEITGALLIDNDNNDLLVDEKPDSIDEEYINGGILELCGSLLEVRSASSESVLGLSTIHLTHFSVKEYFVSIMSKEGSVTVMNDRKTRSSEAIHNSILAKMCLRYVNIRRVWQNAGNVEPDQVERAFRDYAAGSWYQHVAMSETDETDVTLLTNTLLDSQNPNWDSWREWFELNDPELKAAKAKNEVMATSPVYYASRLGLARPLSLLLHERKYDPNADAGARRTALCTACERGDLKIVRLLLEAGADLTITDDHRWSPVNSAAYGGHFEVVKFLLVKGADITVTSDKGWTPLHSAAYFGHTQVVELLLVAGAEIAVTTNTANCSGWSPLNAAAFNGHTEVVKLLLEKGADMSSRSTQGLTALNSAASCGHVEVARLLLDKGADITATMNDGWTSLNLAAFYGYTEVAKLLLERGADTTVTNYNGWTPLHSATEFGHIEIVKLLLEKGADVTLCTKDGWTVLPCASENGHFNVVKLLLENGADVTDRYRGLTSFHHASARGHVDIYKVLLENGANVSDKTNDGRTALQLASLNGKVDIVRLLLQEPGINISSTDNIGRTALFYAAWHGHPEVVQLLLSERQAELQVRDRYDATPLFAATRHGHEKVMELLLATDDTCVEFRDGIGRTLVWWARKSGNANVIQLILRHAQKTGVEISDDVPVETISTAPGKTYGYCDVCTLDITEKDDYYACALCSNGDFFICMECYGFSVKCEDGSHSWVLRRSDP